MLQNTAGVPSYIYWLSSYAFDLLLYVCYSFVLLLVIFLHGLIFVNVFSGLKNLGKFFVLRITLHERELKCILGALYVILLLYGISGIPFGYIFSYSKHSAGGIFHFLLASIISGFVLTVSVFISELSNYGRVSSSGSVLRNFGYFLPQFSLTYNSVQFCRNTVWRYNWNIKPLAQQDLICLYNWNPCCGL